MSFSTMLSLPFPEFFFSQQPSNFFACYDSTDRQTFLFVKICSQYYAMIKRVRSYLNVSHICLIDLRKHQYVCLRY